MRTSIFFSILFVVSYSFAAPEDRKDWLANFKKAFIDTFCNAPEVLNCYTNFNPSCFEQVSSKISVCVTKVKVPEKIKLGPESGVLGAEIGRCVGRELNQNLKKKKTEDPKCKSLL